MTAPALELQGLIIATLRGDAAVSALVDGIYDRPPADRWAGAHKAYISLGPSDVLIDDADCVNGETVTAQVDVWSQQPGQVECKRICAAVKAALHDRDLVLTDNALVQMTLDLTRIMADPDGITTHGAMQFTAMIEAT